MDGHVRRDGDTQRVDVPPGQMDLRQARPTVVADNADPDVEAHEERSAWARLASACEVALTDLHPHHPQRGEFVAMWTECRRAAGLPYAPVARLTA